MEAGRSPICSVPESITILKGVSVMLKAVDGDLETRSGDGPAHLLGNRVIFRDEIE